MKRLIIFGDSISTTHHGNEGYIRLLKNAALFDDIQTFAISASGLTSETPNNLYEKISEFEFDIKRASHLLLWHGTNDWYYHVTCDVFIKQMETIHHMIMAWNPNIHILLLTPILRYQALYLDSQVKNGFIEGNRHDETLIDFEKSICLFAEEKQIDVINVRKNTPFLMENIHRYYEDDVHPNELGYQMIVKPIIAFYNTKG